MTVRKLDLDNIAGCKSLAHAKPGDLDVIQQFRGYSRRDPRPSSNRFLRAEFGRLRTISRLSSRVLRARDTLPAGLSARNPQESRGTYRQICLFRLLPCSLKKIVSHDVTLALYCKRGHAKVSTSAKRQSTRRHWPDHEPTESWWGKGIGCQGVPESAHSGGVRSCHKLRERNRIMPSSVRQIAQHL